MNKENPLINIFVAKVVNMLIDNNRGKKTKFSQAVEIDEMKSSMDDDDFETAATRVYNYLKMEEPD